MEPQIPCHLHNTRGFPGSLVVQMVKNLPAMPATWVRSLGHEDPLEEGTATHSSILAWRIPWTEEPVRLLSIGSHKVTMIIQMWVGFFFFCIDMYFHFSWVN